MLALLERYARLGDIPILLEGESGTGKTAIARYVHEVSPRAHGPFESVIISGLDDSLASADLFGYVPGAYTGAGKGRAGLFAATTGGTLFIDEIGKASVTVQRKLLHVVEYSRFKQLGSDRDTWVSVRVVAATNVPLPRLVEEGKFLADLEARFLVCRIRIPALRQRPDDIPIFVHHFLKKFAGGCGYVESPTVQPELMAILQRGPWPLNLRQLEAVVLRLLINADGAPVLTSALLDTEVEQQLSGNGAAKRGPLNIPEARRAIAEGKSKAAVARLLGVDRTTLYRMLKRNER